MDSLDLCLPKALAELNLLEQYKLNTLVHKWRDVVGDVIADHTKIVSIKPPDMVISADNSMWMQELQMQKRRIIEAINKYYRQEVITDIRFIMKRQSYVKVEINTSLTIPDEQIITKRINFANIVLSKEDVDAIDKSLEQTDNEELRAAFRKVQITARKREIYLEQHGYHRCKRCGMHMESKRDICPTCEYELHRKHIKDIKSVIRKYPYFKYSDCQQFIQCTFPDFAEAMRESIYFYLDKIYKGSINRRHMFMVAMLITHKKPDELTDQHVINLCNKYRSKFLAEEEQRTLLEALQQHIFWFSAELASDSEQPSPGKRYISSEEIALLEQTIDREMARVPALHQFVLPGRCEAASRLHLARTVARRAERRLVELAAEVTIRQILLRYLNRLSDCLYALARSEDHAAHQRRLVTEIAARYLAASRSPAPDAPKAQAGSLSFHELHQLIRQAIEHARQLQVPVVISIVDAHGTETVTWRMPDALLVSSELAPKKAWTAVAMKTATHELATTVQPGAALYGLESHLQGKVVTFGGGYPLWRDGQLIAGLGISGGSVEQDMAIAQAAMAAINVRTHQ